MDNRWDIPIIIKLFSGEFSGGPICFIIRDSGQFFFYSEDI